MIYKKFEIPCPLPVLDHNVGNLTFNSTLPMHVILLPNNSESTNVNFMMDYTHRNPAGLDENQATGPLHSSGVEYEAHSDDKCQPKYFVFNSRVSNRSMPPNRLSGAVVTEFYFTNWEALESLSTLGLQICLFVCFTDRLCNPNPSIRFCLPPRGPTHLQWT